MLEQYNMSIHISTSTAQVLVEQRKKNGVVTRKNISYQSLSECFLTSRVDDERHDTGLLPEGCIAVVIIWYPQNIACQRVQPGRVFIDRQGVVAQADTSIAVHIGKRIAVKNGVLLQTLILHYADAASGNLAGVRHILEAEYQARNGEVPILCIKISEIGVQLRIANEVVGKLFLHHNRDAVLRQ